MSKSSDASTKKKMNKLTKVFIIIISCVLVVVLAAGGVLIYMQSQKSTNYVPAEQNRHNFEGLLVRPSFAGAVDADIPENETEIIGYAYSLYTEAMTNAKDCEKMLAFSNCATIFSVIGVSNVIDLDIVILKNQNNFFRIDYRLKNNVPFLNIKAFAKQINEGLDLVITERYYTDTSMDAMIYQKVRNSSVDENNIPSADWASSDFPITEKELPKQVYNSSQDGPFTLVGYDVSPETIKSAVVTHNKKDKFYSIDLVFDCDVPSLTADVINLIRDGSGDPNAHYNEMTMTFTVWDNGYLRSLKSYETWSAAALGVSALKFESIFDYNWMISYDETDCDMSKCADLQLMKSHLE